MTFDFIPILFKGSKIPYWSTSPYFSDIEVYYYNYVPTKISYNGGKNVCYHYVFSTIRHDDTNTTFVWG